VPKLELHPEPFQTSHKSVVDVVQSRCSVHKFVTADERPIEMSHTCLLLFVVLFLRRPAVTGPYPSRLDSDSGLSKDRPTLRSPDKYCSRRAMEQNKDFQPLTKKSLARGRDHGGRKVADNIHREQIRRRYQTFKLTCRGHVITISDSECPFFHRMKRCPVRGTN
jgi:hypothetical protein